MTDRDTFAAAALTGLIACMKDETCGEICESAYWWADAMLSERGDHIPDAGKCPVAKPSPFNLTNEERKALERVCVAYELLPTLVAKQVADTLLKLLERLA